MHAVARVICRTTGYHAGSIECCGGPTKSTTVSRTPECPEPTKCQDESSAFSKYPAEKKEIVWAPGEAVHIMIFLFLDRHWVPTGARSSTVTSKIERANRDFLSAVKGRESCYLHNSVICFTVARKSLFAPNIFELPSEVTQPLIGVDVSGHTIQDSRKYRLRYSERPQTSK